jgi:hypothetical protein
MPEALVLRFEVDKNGVIQLQGMEDKIRGVTRATRDTNAEWDRMSGLMRASVLVTGLNQGLSVVSSLVSKVQELGQALEHIDDVMGTAKWVGQIGMAEGLLREDFISDLQKATGGRLNTEQLDEMVARLKNAEMSAESMSVVVASAFSKMTTEGHKMETTLKAVEMAIGGEQERGLRRVGFYVDFAAAYAKAAKELSVPVTALTRDQKLLAREMEVVRVMGGYVTPAVEGLGSAYGRLSASLHNLKNELLASLSGVKGWQDVDVLTDVFKLPDVEAQLGALPAAIADTQRQIAQLRAKADEAFRESVSPFVDYSAGGSRFADQAEDLKAQAAAMEATITIAGGILTGQLAKLAKDSKEAAENIAGIPGASLASFEALDQLVPKMDASSERMLELSDMAEDLAKKMPSLSGPLGDLAKQLYDAALATAEQSGRAERLMGVGNATSAAVRQWHKELLGLSLRQKDLSAVEKQRLLGLAEVIDSYQKVNKVSIEYAATLSSVLSVTASLAKAEIILPGGTPEAIGAVAKAMDAVGAAQSELEKGIKDSDPVAQSRAWATLEGAVESYRGALAHAGVSTDEIAKATDTLTRTMAMLRTQAAAGIPKSWLDGLEQIKQTSGDASWAFARWWEKVSKPPAKTPKDSGGGGGSRQADISEAELELRQQIAAATDDLLKSEMEYELALAKLGEQHKSGSMRAREYAASVAEAEGALNAAYRQAAAAEEALHKEQEERRLDAEQEIMRTLASAYDRLTEAKFELAAATGALTKKEAESLMLTRRLMAADETDAKVLEIDARITSMQREAEAQEHLADAALRLQVATGALTQQQADSIALERQYWGAEEDTRNQILAVHDRIAAIELERETMAEWEQALAGVGQSMMEAIRWGEELNQIAGQSEPFSDRTKMIAANWSALSDSMAKIVGSIGKSNKEIGIAIGESSGALFQMFSAWDSPDAKTAFNRMGIFSIAQAGLFGAFLAWPQAAGALLSAGQFFWLAGQSGGGGSKGVARTLGTSGAQQAQSGAPVYYTQNIYGLLGTPEQVGDQVAGLLTASYRGGSNSGMLPGGMMRRA